MENGDAPVKAGDVVGVEQGLPRIFGELAEVVGEVEAGKGEALGGKGIKLENVAQNFARSQINLGVGKGSEAY